MTTIALKTSDPCPCGRDRSAGQCCISNGVLGVPVLPLSQRVGEPTGIRRKGCYAAALGDCSERLSREHFVSDALIKRFSVDGKGIEVDGLSGGAVKKRKVGIRSFASKVLCERHNSMLSFLDSSIVEFFDSIARKPRKGVFVRNNGNKVRLFNGHALEMWLLKLACGMLASGNLDFPGKPKQWKPPTWILHALFGNETLPAPAGLYYIDQKNNSKINISVRAFGSKGVWSSVKCTLNQLTFDLRINSDSAYQPFDIRGTGFSHETIAMIDKQRIERLEFVSSKHLRAFLLPNMGGPLTLRSPDGQVTQAMNVPVPKALFRPKEIRREGRSVEHIFLAWHQAGDKERITLHFAN